MGLNPMPNPVGDINWWGIVNPAAGVRDDAAVRTRNALDELGVSADLTVTKSASHAAEVVSEGIAGGRNAFLVVGGEGTVNVAVNALLENDWAEPPLLGILPAGSGCDFIRNFGISQELEEAAQHLATPNARLVDAGVLEGAWGRHFFINFASVGLTAEIAERSEGALRRLGRLRYQIAIWPALAFFPIGEVELTAGDAVFTGPAIMIVFANGQFVARGMHIAPKADPEDGILDVQVFSGPKRLAVILKPKIQRGTHLSHPAVHHMPAPAFTLKTEHPWPVEADGELPGTGTELRGSALPGAIRLKV